MSTSEETCRHTVIGHGAHGGERRARLGLPSILAVVGVLWMLVGAQGAQGAECPNEAIRVAQSATALPDCRAYELVSPSAAVPYLQAVSDETLGARASSAGGGIAWFSDYPLAGSFGGSYDLSRRGPDGWATESNAVPPFSSRNSEGACSPAMFFSADLSMGLLSDGAESLGVDQGSDTASCQSNDPPLVADEPEGFRNVFLRDNATGGYRLVDVTPRGVVPANALFQDASGDLSHVLFTDDAQLTVGAPAGASLYEWAGGAVHLVTVLPDGTPGTGALPGALAGIPAEPGGVPVTHPVSADGTRVVFEAEGGLYLRKNVEREQSAMGPGGVCLESTKACTVQLDASRTGGQGGGGSFLAADTAVTEIFFTDEAALTAGSTGGTGQHLYEYDAQSGVLVDLTPAGGVGLGGLGGISDDGSYLYFVARGVLAGGATPSQPNLYVLHAGKLTFIATLAEEDGNDASPARLTARVSPDGRYFGFTSIRSLTGYDNTPVQPRDCLANSNSAPEPCNEIFLYDAVASSLSCVSCAPDGSRPTGPAAIQAAEETATAMPAPVYLQRNVLDDGSVFFDTASPLLPGAGNGVRDVYEYAGGHLSLISSGSSPENSIFYEASPDGEDVFFVTTQHLVGSDVGNGMRLYDARVNGGFTEPAAPVACAGEGCRGQAAAAPAPQTLASAGLQGSGNLPAPLAEHAGTVKPKRKTLTRKQKLRRALDVCRREKNKHRRAACERRARTSISRGR